MKVAIFGSLNITNEQAQKVLDIMDDYFQETVSHGLPTILTGGASGVQAVVQEVYETVVFKPWTQISRKLEKQAIVNGVFDPIYFFFRNIQIVDNADQVLIFDTGEKCAEVSRVRELCARKNKEVKEFNI